MHYRFYDNALYNFTMYLLTDFFTNGFYTQALRPEFNIGYI